MTIAVYNINGQIVYFLDGEKLTLLQLINRVSAGMDRLILENKLNSLMNIGVQSGEAYECELKVMENWIKTGGLASSIQTNKDLRKRHLYNTHIKEEIREIEELAKEFNVLISIKQLGHNTGMMEINVLGDNESGYLALEELVEVKFLKLTAAERAA